MDVLILQTSIRGITSTYRRTNLRGERLVSLSIPAQLRFISEANLPPGPANLIISAALTPAPGTDADFDAWYRQEHCRDVSLCPGHRRTRRYKLTFARQNRKDSSENELDSPPVYLALHEFDGEELPAELQKTAETEWAKKSMGGLVGSEVKIFKLLKGFGDVDARY